MIDNHLSKHLRAANIDIAPLSVAQEQLYFLHLLDPANQAYNESIGFRIEGSLDLEALFQAVEIIVDRHATLRTQFRSFNGETVQFILPRHQPSVHHHESSGLTFTEILQTVAAEIKRPFQLAHEPAFRCHLWRHSPEEHVLLFSAHHIVADGWSVSILCEELSTAYAAITGHKNLELPPLPMQYADYSKAQRSWLSTPAFGCQMQEYTRLLDDAPLISNLPFDHRRPHRPTYRGACHSHPISKNVSQQIRSLALYLRSTPFIVLLTACQLLLQRYSGQENVLIGTPVASRYRRDLERVIGLFANVVIVRGRISSSATFLSAVVDSKESLLRSLRYSRIPFEKLVERVCRVRDIAVNPITQVILAFNNQPSSTFQMSGLRVTRLPFPIVNAKLDLHVSIEDRNEGSQANFIYNTDLFDTSTVVRLAEDFVEILAEGVASPSKTSCRLALRLPQKNYAASLSLTDDLPVTSDDFAHNLFERQADKTPQAIAAEMVGQKTTYAELRAIVRLTAAKLREFGVGPEQIVGLYLARNLDIVAAPLAVLTASATYLPLDPDYPPERLKAMLEDARPEVLLVSKTLHDKAQALFSGPILTIESSTPEPPPDTEASRKAFSSVSADQLAYVIYTSGSTGRPKGVQISHRALANFLKCMLVAPGLSSSDIFLSVTTPSFDIAALEIFLPLAVGARTFIAHQECVNNGQMLSQLLGTSGATVMQSTPSTWRMLLGAGWPGSPQLAALCGGEALDLQLANDLLNRCRSLWNLYGPTETTIWSTLCRVHRSSSSISIGFPIANTEAYILDTEWNLVPPGVPGELYIGGLGLARGYRNRPGLTAERFIPDEFSRRRGARLYGTGDLARQLPDGEFRVLGRLDQQVKVRGHRVELNEIEEALNGHSAVTCSAVIWHESVAGDGRLVAYVQLKENFPDAVDWTALLKLHVRRILPGYAVPSRFVQVDSMPVTPNGKLDRKALPPAGFKRMDLTLAPAVSPTEKALSKIWCEVLELGEIGRDENFFELGGHSLLAGKIIARIQDAFSVDIPFSALFDFPELAMLAAHIDSIKQTARDNVITKVPRSGEGFPLSFAQRRLWFIHQLAPADDDYHIAAAFRIHGQFDFDVLHRAIEYLAIRHEAIRTRFTTDAAKRPIQIIDEWSTVECSLSEVGPTSPDFLATHLVNKWSREPFSLERGPLMKVRCARFSSEDHLLVFVMHHIVADGWSTGILIRELSDVYAKIRAGESPSLPPLAIQYADYAVWQTRTERCTELDQQLDFWRCYLEGTPSTFQFTEPAAIDGAGDDGSTLPIEFPPELVFAIKACAQQERVTMFMVLLAAFSTVLSSMSPDDTIVIGTDVSGRTVFNTEGVVGIFINQLALRVDLSGEPTFRNLIARIKATTLAALANQDVPFERLVKELQPERNISTSPLFQIKLVLQDTNQTKLEFPAAIVEGIPVEHRKAKFEALVNLAPTDDRLVGYIEHRQSFISQRVAAEMVEQFHATLSRGVSDPALSVTYLQGRAKEGAAAMRAKRELLAEVAIERSLALAKRK